MDNEFIVRNLRLYELVQIVGRNRAYFDDFVAFLKQHGYASIYEFVQDKSDEAAGTVIAAFLTRQSPVQLNNGLSRPYPWRKANWFFLAWLLRDAATQRLQPLLSAMPGDSDVARKVQLINALRRDAAELFPERESWEWAAISEVILARLEGSRRALKGAVLEAAVRLTIQALIEQEGLDLVVHPTQVKINSETYDIQVTGAAGTLLLPVKTRETMGGGHARLFTRDIHQSIMQAVSAGYRCVPVVIAESWLGNLEALGADHVIYIQANPNQIEQVALELKRRMPELTGLLRILVKREMGLE